MWTNKWKNLVIPHLLNNGYCSNKWYCSYQKSYILFITSTYFIALSQMSHVDTFDAIGYKEGTGKRFDCFEVIEYDLISNDLISPMTLILPTFFLFFYQDQKTNSNIHNDIQLLYFINAFLGLFCRIFVLCKAFCIVISHYINWA